MSIKKEIEAAAIAAIKCPTCGAKPGVRCVTKNYINVPTHQRRLSTFIAQDITKEVL